MIYLQHQKLQHLWLCHYKNSTSLHYEILFCSRNTHFSLSLSSTILVAPNKQFVNFELLAGFLGQESKL